MLFVDDDPAVLDGLRRLLRPLRDHWELEFASGGQAGLEALDQTPPDVLVTDIRMPGVDGITLLQHAAENHPNVVRIVLSGHTEREEFLRRRMVAHRFLTKPCRPKDLEDAVREELSRVREMS